MNHRFYHDYIYYAVINDESFLLAQNGYYYDEGYNESYLILDGKKQTCSIDWENGESSEKIPSLMQPIYNYDFFNYLNGKYTESKKDIDELLEGNIPTAFVMFSSVYDNLYKDCCYNSLSIITKDKIVEIPLN